MQEELAQTPFSQEKAILPAAKSHNKLLLVAGACILILLLALVALLLRSAKSSDKFRTLEEFPVSEYMESYETLLGGRFMLNATVDAELGTEEGLGKLVVFRDSQSKKVVPVLIPTPVIPNYALSKSQKYNLAIEVTRFGVLNAVELEKE